MDENTIMKDLQLPFPQGYAYCYANDGDRYGFGIPKHIRLGSHSWDVEWGDNDWGEAMDKDKAHKGDMLVRTPIPLDMFVKILRNYTTPPDGIFDLRIEDLKTDMNKYQEMCPGLFTDLEKGILDKAYGCLTQEELDQFVQSL